MSKTVSLQGNFDYTRTLTPFPYVAINHPLNRDIVDGANTLYKGALLITMLLTATKYITLGQCGYAIGAVLLEALAFCSISCIIQVVMFHEDKDIEQEQKQPAIVSPPLIVEVKKGGQKPSDTLLPSDDLFAKRESQIKFDRFMGAIPDGSLIARDAKGFVIAALWKNRFLSKPHYSQEVIGEWIVNRFPQKFRKNRDGLPYSGSVIMAAKDPNKRNKKCNINWNDCIENITKDSEKLDE